MATTSGTDDSTEGAPGPSQLGTGEAIPSRRRKPATRAKYGSPSRKTGDTGKAARRKPASAGVRTVDRYTARRAPRCPGCDVLSPAEAGYGRWGSARPPVWRLGLASAARYAGYGRMATISGTDHLTEGARGPSQLGTWEAIPSRRRKPATRAKYGSPSRKTGDTGAAARR